MDCSTFNSKCTLGSGDCIHKSPTFDALRNSHNDTSLKKGAPNLTADHVQQFLCGKVSNFIDQKWKGGINLPLIPVTDALIHQHGSIDKVLSSHEATPIDICDYIGNSGDTSTLCLSSTLKYTHLLRKDLNMCHQNHLKRGRKEI